MQRRASRQLGIAVIGAGHMGRLHAEKVAALRDEGAGVEVAGVVDIIPARAEALASKVGAPAYTDVRQLLALCGGARGAIGEGPVPDAVIVAVPTLCHFEVVRASLLAGIDVLVEKPIASTLDEAAELLALAESGERVLQVGHLEWYNGALEGIRDRVRDPRFVEAHRMGPFPDRATDIDIVRDLMIHDLDILQQILGEEPLEIEAVGIPVLTPNVDIANARITFPGGCVGNLTASRVSNTPQRKIRFFQQDGCVSIDLLAQSATIFRREQVNGGAPQIHVEELEVDRSDALLSQLRAFTRAVRTRERPHVDGAGGLDALRTAVRVVDAMLPPHQDP